MAMVYLGAAHARAPRAAAVLLQRFAVLALCLLSLLVAAPARADVLDEIELLRVGGDAVVRVRFSVRIQYLRNLPIGNDGVDVFFQYGGAAALALADEQLRVKETPAFPGVTVNLPLQGATAQPARLNVRFTRPVALLVRPYGANAIDIVVKGLGGQVSATRVRPDTGPPPVPAEERYVVRLQTFASRDMPDARPVPRDFQEFSAFTSQTVVDGKPLYELMLGYFASEADAEGARRRLTARFPEAIVVDLAKRRDDSLKAAAAAAAAAAPAVLPVVPVPSVPPVAALPVIPAAPVAPPTPAPTAPAKPAAGDAAPLPAVRAPEDIERQATELMSKARGSLANRAPQDAVESLNQLLTLPPNSLSEGAQELIGQAREQNGEIAKARAEYELYLKLFPTGAGAARVKARLAQLGAAAAATAAGGATGTARRERPPVKSLTGSFSQYYFGGKTQIENVFNTPTVQERSTFSATDQSSLLSAIDLNGRYRAGDTEQRVVFRDSYNLSFLAERESYNRLNAAYYDYRGLTGGLSARLGRQSGLAGGLPGRFDGGVLGFGSQRVRLNAAAGQPVEFNKIESKRRFGNVNLEVSGLAEHWHGNLFGVYQDVDGIKDRQAVGTELRYIDGARSLFGLADYDTSYKVMNAASLQGSWTTKGGTALNFLWDRRRAPALATTNAIFGQPTTSIRELLATSTEGQLRDAALKITAIATQATLGVTTPISERWQIGADARLINVGALPEVVVNGLTIPGQPATGDVISYSLQAIGTRLYSPRDSNVWTVMLVNAPSYESWLVTYNNVTHLGAKWSVEPSVRYYVQSDVTDVRLVRVSPGLRLTWRPTLGSSIELDALYESTRTTAPTVSDTTRRYFYSLGYRLDI